MVGDGEIEGVDARDETGVECWDGGFVFRKGYRDDHGGGVVMGCFGGVEGS